MCVYIYLFRQKLLHEISFMQKHMQNLIEPGTLVKNIHHLSSSASISFFPIVLHCESLFFRSERMMKKKKTKKGKVIDNKRWS